MNRRRILVVDDEVGFTSLLKLNLERTEAYEVRVENRPHDAMSAAREFKPDLIILDVMMPGVDGGQLAARFQSHSVMKNVPLLFLTAAAKREEVESHHGWIGGFPFLAKPASIEQIVAQIESSLGPAMERADSP